MRTTIPLEPHAHTRHTSPCTSNTPNGPCTRSSSTLACAWPHTDTAHTQAPAPRLHGAHHRPHRHERGQLPLPRHLHHLGHAQACAAARGKVGAQRVHDSPLRYPCRPTLSSSLSSMSTPALFAPQACCPITLPLIAAPTRRTQRRLPPSAPTLCRRPQSSTLLISRLAHCFLTFVAQASFSSSEFACMFAVNFDSLFLARLSCTVPALPLAIHSNAGL